MSRTIKLPFIRLRLKWGELERSEVLLLLLFLSDCKYENLENEMNWKSDTHKPTRNVRLLRVLRYKR